MNAIQKIDRRLHVLRSQSQAPAACECDEPVIVEELEVETSRPQNYSTVDEDSHAYNFDLDAGDGMSYSGEC